MADMGTLLMAMVEDIIEEDIMVEEIGHQTTDQAINLDLRILPQDQDDQRLYLQIDHLRVDLQRGRHDP